MRNTCHVDSGKSITREQKEILRKWIAQGAEYQGHWAFITPDRPEVPVHPGAGHPVDAFLTTRLKTEGLSMKKEADKETLLRRASLDLTGLPPTLEEMDAFAKDKSPNAYEKALDRLLASPHFGERMALEWLDLVAMRTTTGSTTGAGTCSSGGMADRSLQPELAFRPIHH